MLEVKPRIEVLGVYHVPSDEKVAREQLWEYYDKQTVHATDTRVTSYIESVVPLVVFDALISGLDGQFKVGDFTQEMQEAPPEAWQVAYDEALLSPDGAAVLDRSLGCADRTREARVAFYFHYYDPSRPMQWSYGTFQCPSVQPVPQHLLNLLPYHPPG